MIVPPIRGVAGGGDGDHWVDFRNIQEVKFPVECQGKEELRMASRFLAQVTNWVYGAAMH